MSPLTLPAMVPATIPDTLAEPLAVPATQPAVTQPAMTQPLGGFFGGPATHPTGLMPAPGGFGGIAGTFPSGAGGAPAGTMPTTVQAVAVSRPANEADPYSVAFWCSILLGVVLLGFWGIMIMRRRLNAQGESNDDAGFSLSELRAMRDRGEITPEEYERTRTHVIAKVKASFDKPRKSAPPDLAADDEPGK